MANPFMKNQSSQYELYQQKYKASRMNLLIVFVFTAINMLLLITNADSYFLFSAFVPYIITSFGMLMCGRFPEEYYADGLEDFVLLDNSFFFVLLAISIVIALLYLLAWFMSGKNRVGWLIFALVFFGIDTLIMFVLSGISLESIIDILFHVWVIYELIVGIRAHYKLKSLPAEEEAIVPDENIPQHTQENEENSETVTTKVPNSYIIRVADKDVKHRVLLDAYVLNYDICYRRVKHTNELVINGNVYDELEGVLEYPHVLKAWIDGHYISASYNGSHSIISFDGEKVAKKLRLI